MSGRKKDSGKYFAGALMLIALMIIAIVLGWYGLQVAKESLSNTTTLSNVSTPQITNASTQSATASNTSISNTSR